MRKTLLFFCLLLALGAQAQGGGHFLQNDQYRQKVMQAFDARMKLMGKDCFNVKGLGANGVETEALQFLYAYMPMADGLFDRLLPCQRAQVAPGAPGDGMG